MPILPGNESFLLNERKNEGNRERRKRGSVLSYAHVFATLNVLAIARRCVIFVKRPLEYECFMKARLLCDTPPALMSQNGATGLEELAARSLRIISYSYESRYEQLVDCITGKYFVCLKVAFLKRIITCSNRVIGYLTILIHG